MAKRMKKISDEDIAAFFNADVFFPTRTIMIGPDDEINNKVAIDVIKLLHILHTMDATAPINVMLYSQGGCITAGFSIYDAIRLLPNPVHIQVFGESSSIASIILQAGTTRTVAENVTSVIHFGTTDRGNMSLEGVIDLANTELAEIKRMMLDVYVERIKEKHRDYDERKLIRMLKKDTFLNASKMVELGLADSISKRSK
jgi:ATP-dependent protease ClpP protease subunit